MSTQNFKPLFAPGLHECNVDDLHDLLVAPFEDLGHRQKLLSRFLVLLDIICLSGLSYEVWIDGSFVTKKDRPNDVDAVFFADEQSFNQLSVDKRKTLSSLFAKQNKKEIKLRYYSDIYFAPKNNDIWRTIWEDTFGSDRNGNPKGILRLLV